MIDLILKQLHQAEELQVNFTRSQIIEMIENYRELYYDQLNLAYANGRVDALQNIFKPNYAEWKFGKDIISDSQ
jgi:hypothetical protein